MIKITIEGANAGLETRELEDGEHVVGRERGDIVLGDPNISSRHAVVRVQGQDVQFIDQNSTNGSFSADGTRLQSAYAWHPGATLLLGGLKLTREAESVQPGGTQVMAAAPMPIASSQAAPASATASPVAAASASDVAPRGAPATSGSYSWPDSPVRHRYPLAIKDASIGTALSLVMKTLPFALARLGVLVAMTVVGIIWWAITLGGFGFFALKTHPVIGYGWLGINLVGMGYIWWAVARYFLYLLKAAHIAVLTELITTGTIQNGEVGMFQYGIKTVKDRFGEVNILFGIDLLVHGIVKAFNRTLDFITGLIPIPGLDSLMGIVKSVLHATTTYIDETIFSYNLARGDENAYRSAKDGLVYYAQNSKEILKTGIWAVIIDKVLTAVIWIFMLAPAFALGAILPTSGAWVTISAFVAAVVFAGDVRAAFVKPLLLTMVMIKFHTEASGQEINPVWDQRLESASNKFGQLREKAANWVAPKTKEKTPAAAA